MAVYTLFGQPASPAALATDSGTYEMGVQFSVSADSELTAIWFYSAPGAVSLPAEIDLYLVSGAGLVSSQTASWSGAAGSGWVRAAFSTPAILQTGTSYKACILANAGSNFYAATNHYWDTGPGASGITSGPLSAPNNAGGNGGQDTFISATAHAYPNTSSNATNYWIDPEITTFPPGQPFGNPSGGPWVKVFEDHFDSPVNGKPDPAIWATHFIEGDSFRQENGSNEIGWSPHNKANLSVASSVLTITASFQGAWPAMLTADPATPNPTPAAANGGTQPSYVTGLIQSHPGFQQSYGYFEARIQVPNLAGAWPAFWMHTSDGGWPPEIDIEESSFPPVQTSTYHDPSGTNYNGTYPTADYTQWHIFGVRWTPTDITFFLDGVQNYTTSTNITSDPMHLIADLAVTTSANSATFPSQMHIDYIRAWTVTGVPAQPVITSVSPANGVPAANGNLTVSFGAVSGATSYRVTGCPVDAAAAVPSLVDGPHNYATGSAGPITISSLKPGVPYTVTVAAINATGYSTESLPVPSLAPASGSGLLLAAFP